MKWLITYFLAIVGAGASGQILDSFYAAWPEDPAWIGDMNKFKRAGGLLELDDSLASSSNSAELYMPILMSDSFFWQSGCKLDFSPSSSNFARLVIYSDRPNLDESEDAMWVRIGGQSGSVDNLRLFARAAGNDSLLWQSPEGSASDNPDFKIAVTYRHQQLEVKVDSAGLAIWTDSIAFKMHGWENGFLGYLCRYSATRSNKIQFLPTQFAPRLLDQSPPRITKVDWSEDGWFRLMFSESILMDSIQLPQNADSLFWENSETCMFHIVDSNSGQDTIFIKNMVDVWGNEADSTLVLERQPALPGQVLLTEIHSKPDSFLGNLPPKPFLEIQNVSPFTFSLKGWTIQDKLDYENERFREMGWTYLGPGETAILCQKDDSIAFSGFGKVICPQSFPSLNQSSDWLVIRNSKRQVIEKCRYTGRNFGDDYRADGGFSLERKLNFDCGLQTAFSVSELQNGGSPGIPPELSQAEFDSIPLRPRLIRWRPDSSLLIQWPLALQMEVLSADFWGRKNQVFPAQINEERYYFHVDSLAFCDGRVLRDWSFEMTAPRAPQARDIILHEVLFNPQTGKSDFLEIRNTSDETLLLDRLMLVQNSDFDSWPYQDWAVFPGGGLFLQPDSVIYVCKDCRNASSGFPLSDTFNCLSLNDFPGIPDQGAWLALLDSSIELTVLDSATVRDKFHHPILRNEDGFSLQRRWPGLLGKQADNWFSGSQSSGGASPGILNPQESPLETDSGSIFQIYPKYFSPALGPNGACRYLIAPGTDLSTAFLDIYNSKGFKVKSLMNNELIGERHEGYWGGMDNSGNLAPPGNYILRLQLIYPGGRIYVARSLVALKY